MPAEFCEAYSSNEQLPFRITAAVATIARVRITSIITVPSMLTYASAVPHPLKTIGRSMRNDFRCFFPPYRIGVELRFFEGSKT